MKFKVLTPTIFFFTFMFTSSGNATNLLDVYESAKASDPVLAGAHATHQARKQAMPQARSALLPNITLGGSKSENTRKFPGAVLSNDPTNPLFGLAVPTQKFDDTVWQAQATQPLLDMESWYTFKSAKASVKQADADYTAAEQNLIVRVVEAYLNVLRAQDRLDAATAEEAAVKRQLEQVQQRFDVGLVAITDVLESTAAYDNASVRRIQADGDHDIFFETLRTLSGVAYPSLDRLSEELPIVNPPGVESVWTDQAMLGNLSIQAAEQQLMASKQSLKARRSSHLPTVQGVVTHSEFETGGSSFLGSRTNTTTYALQARIPVFQGGFIHSRAREAKYQMQAAEQQLLERQLNVTRDTRNLFRAVSTDVLRVNARQRAIKSSESALEATETGYEVGTRNIVDVLQAQQRLFSSQFDYADSRYNYVLDLLRLKQATGSLEKSDLLKLNDFTTTTGPVQNKTAN